MTVRTTPRRSGVHYRNLLALVNPKMREATIGAILISDVAPPSWRPNAGWMPALHLKLGRHPTIVPL
jgi:hypothetical protein